MTKEFSEIANVYARARPNYPQKFLEQIIEVASSKKLLGGAWDAATGNYQIANKLADYFSPVYANDISAEQLSVVKHKDNIISFESACENVPNISDKSIQLVTCGQAFHWFDKEKFFKEVRRVLVSSGVIAIVGYSRPYAENKDIDLIIQQYFSILKPYRDKKLETLDNNYRDVAMPFTELDLESAYSESEWAYDGFVNYFASSEMVTRAVDATGINPILPLTEKLEKLIGSKSERIKFEFFGRLGVNSPE